MLDFYIHQIGDIYNEKTYNRLIKILQYKVIGSRNYLEINDLDYDQDNRSFKLEIPKGKEETYYDEDIHKDRVSLSDPQNRFIKHAIERKSHQFVTCFDYSYIAIAVSRSVPILSKEETKGLALGEVQVRDKIDGEFIEGIILPISKEEANDEDKTKIINTISELCERNDMPLDIYNYDGELLKEKTKRLSR